MAAVSQATGISPTSDWPGRYRYVDQILDKPGPRTDPAFTPGEKVRECQFEVGFHPEVARGRSRISCGTSAKFL